MRYVLSLALALSLLGASLLRGNVAHAEDCQFILGFKTLHDLIPSVVGNCVVDEHHNPTNGDGLQETTGPTGAGGLLVWRKADNFTAFTDGYRTWVNGPFGLQERLNTERFPWEENAVSGTPTVGYLEGKVNIGPLVPVERAGVPPPTPSPALCTAQSFLVSTTDGTREIARFNLQPDCSYRVALAPGAYVITLATSNFMFSKSLPATVQIASGATTRLDVSIDTGMR
jgi:hypothetical protein